MGSSSAPQSVTRYQSALDADTHAGITQLSFDRWSTVIDLWNKVPSEERRAIRAVCTVQGHWWVGTPIDAKVCRRCLEYAQD